MLSDDDKHQERKMISDLACAENILSESVSKLEGWASKKFLKSIMRLQLFIDQWQNSRNSPK